MWVQFWLWIATTLLTDYFREALPNVVPSGLGDFQIPTATEGRFVPLAFGTNVIQGPNVTWYGDFIAVERTVSTGLVFKRDEGIGFTYWLGMQMGLLRGRTAGIKRIWVGDDVVWDYLIDNGGNVSDVCDIDRDDLFGGVDSGGGFQGRVRLYDGAPGQGQSDYLKYERRQIAQSEAISPQFEVTERFTNLPNFRGFSYVTISNIEEQKLGGPFGVVLTTTPAETKGANIGEANSMRHMKFEVQTFDTIANGGEDSLGLGNDHHFIGEDMNPIVLAYDSYTNADWGRGFSASDMNLTSFREAAETIWEEGLGFSIIIDQVQKTKDLIDTIEQHIDGYIGPNPITGEMEVILARQDYTPASEFQADETNIISVKKYSRGEYNQTFNEVRVQYTDRQKDYKDNYAPAQDLANLIIQGRPRSKTMRYAGVHEPEIANKIVWRDIKGLAVALAAATIEMDRTAWNLQPGKVVIVTDEEVGIADVPFRIIQIRQGDPLRATILIDVVEDVFGNEVVGFADPPPSEFIPPSVQSFALTEAQQMAMEAPYIININDTEFPENYPRLFTGITTLDALLEYEINMDQSAVSSPTGFSAEGTVSGGVTIVGSLRDALTGWQTGNGTFTISIDPLSGDLGEIIGVHAPGAVGALTGVCVINPNATNEEWVLTDNIEWIIESPIIGSVQLENVYRAALDSVMQVHAPGEPVWFIWTGGTGIAETTLPVTNTVEVKLLPITQTDRVNLTDSPEPPSALPVVVAADARYAKPLVPVDLAFNTESWAASTDFDSVLTGSPVEQGVQVVPSHRLWRTEHVLRAVQSLNSTGAALVESDFTSDVTTYSWYLFDLDVTPNPTRGVDEIDSGEDIPLNAFDEAFTLAKATISASRTTNSFNARLELLTTHSPAGIEGLSPNLRSSREVIQFDFTATGTWIVPAEAAFVHLQFEGEDGSKSFHDSSANRHVVRSCGACEIDTAQKEFGLSSGLFTPSSLPSHPNVDSCLSIRPESDVSGDWNPADDHTIQLRIRSALGADQTYVGQWSGTTYGYSWVWWLDRISSSISEWNFSYSTNGSGIANHFAVGTTFTSTPFKNIWIDLTFVKKTLPGNIMKLTVFIDGVESGTSEIAHPVLYTESPGIPITLFGQDFDRTHFNSGPTTGFDGNVDEFRMVKGYALNLIDFTPEVAAFDATRDEIVFQSDFEGHIEADSFVKAGIIDSGALQLTETYNLNSNITHDISLTGAACLEIDGTHESGLECGGVADDRQWFKNEDFTVEGWVRFRTLPSSKSYGMFMCGVWQWSGNDREWGFGFDENDDLNFTAFWPTGAIGNIKEAIANPSPIPSPKIEINRWYYLAATRNGVELNMYLDGVRVYQGDFFIDETSGSPGLPAHIGDPVSGHGGNLSFGKAAEDESTTGEQSRAMDGYVDHVRVIKGRALYTGDTITMESPFGNVTPWAELVDGFGGDESHRSTNPRRDLAVVPSSQNVGIHIHFDDSDRFEWSPEGTGATDRSINLEDVTIRGAGIEALSPEPVFGGSALRCSPNSPLSYATVKVTGVQESEISSYDDFTLEARVIFNGDPGTAGHTFLGQWDTTSNNRGWYWQLNNNLMEFHWAESTTFEHADSPIFAPWNPVGDTEYHIACVRDRGAMRFYVDGVQLTSSPENAEINRILLSPNLTATQGIGIGCWFVASVPTDVLDGWIHEVRSIPGFAIYDAGFTPHTRDYGGERAVLHMNCDDEHERYAEIMDTSRRQTVIDTLGTSVRGAGQTDGVNVVPTKFGPGAIDCTGASNYTSWIPQLNIHNLLDKEWTCEGWFYFTVDPLGGSNQGLFGHYEATGNLRSWGARFVAANDTFEFQYSTDGTNVNFMEWNINTSPVTIPINEWVHIAICRDNSVSPQVIRFYVNGVEITPGSPDNVVGGASFFPVDSSVNNEIMIGNYTDDTAADIRAYMEDCRIIVGECLYRLTSPEGFTPPTTRQPDVEIPT